MSKKNTKDPQMQLNAYYAATQKYKSINSLLMFVIFALVLLLGFVIYLNQTSIWVAIPGQSFEASRAFKDPYRGFTAEDHMTEFCQLMFTFSADGFEANLDRAEHLATKSVYDKWHNFYYVERQASGQPAYYSWVENSIIVDLQVDSVRHQFLEGGTVYVQLWGKQVFKKDYDYTTKDEVVVQYDALIEPLTFKNSNNRKGMRVVDFQVVKSEAL